MTRRRIFQPANPYQLQLDVDSADDLVHFHKSLTWFSCMCAEQGFPIRALAYQRSRRRAHWHVTITLPTRLRLIERIALQAILGSDRVRELCNWKRVRSRSAHPILFLESKERSLL